MARYRDGNANPSKDASGAPSYPKSQHASNIRTNIQPSTGSISQQLVSDAAGGRQFSEAYLASPLTSPTVYNPISSSEELPWGYLGEPLDQDVITTTNSSSNEGPYENFNYAYPMTMSNPSWNTNWIPRTPSQDTTFPVPYLSLSNVENDVPDTTEYPSYDMDNASQYTPTPPGTVGETRQPRWSSTRRNSTTVKPERRSTRTQPIPGKEQHPPQSRKSSSASTHQLRGIKGARKSSTAEDINHSDNEDSRTTRNNHNLIEKKYRNRLNYQFEELLSTLPKDMEGNAHQGFAGDVERKVSKAEVLTLAKKRIQDLEKTSKSLESDREQLLESVDRLKMDWMIRGGKLLP